MQDLKNFRNDEFDPGGSFLKRGLWFLINALIFNSYLLPFYGLKRSILIIFGAKIGKGVVIKPKVNIKYPWKLSIGDHSWIGERVWLDNLDELEIGGNVCISQEALILSGNHNYRKNEFDLMTEKICIRDGAWIGARSMVTSGVTVEKYAILSVNSVASSDLQEAGIYRGNPAKLIKNREQDES